MTPSSRWVVDSNVLISALLFEDSIPGQAVFRVLDRARLLQSADTLAEILTVLGRKKFDKYVTWDERDAFFVRLARTAVLLVDIESVSACRDPNDDKYLELAVSGQADGLITGDADLLALDPFRGVPILTPARFLELMATNTGSPE